MKKEDLTMELLVGAAADLNEILKLKPQIETEFLSSLKGVALKAAREKFEEQLGKDLIESAQLIAEEDVLKQNTVNVLKALDVLGVKARVAAAEKPAEEKPAEEKKTQEKKGGKERPSKKEVKKTSAKKTETPVKKDEKKKEEEVGKKKIGGSRKYRAGSQSEKIDIAIKKFFKGKKTLDAELLAKETKLSVGRIRAHLAYLKSHNLI